ncbi:hypothetical protein QZM46_09825 [Burkholderia vietnamiensis]|uniref:hypothetical protein n=1 Tax=Burkholderia TaxID=32008 RepID=UPI0005560EBC|nr:MULTISPECIES: hypothetical protein [Burkholderia]AOK43661.1 hypothetical protein WL96_21540 [Burkholderia vietnamiensis]KVE01098.1 hypothetical protein WI91_23975 [Burkholderia vietnamiensis]KVE16984.1 hypothetical protein WI92_06220 [Burkholderia vietnamiensis]KVF97108.1 hypothetical protein WJ21_17285 [Burkholderia vietnamiensis]KVG10148.1 hypothetical protein WJ24_00145 [Burkholderia vietnamiensis]
MSALCMQTIVHGRTVQVVLSPERRTARIHIVDDESGSYPPRTISIERYLSAGMTDEQIARHVLEVVTMSVEQLARLQPFDRASGNRNRTRHSH